MPRGSILGRFCLVHNSFLCEKSHNYLSNHQVKVLYLMSQGLETKEIAHLMDITHGTLKIYKSIIFKILKVSNSTQAVIWALKNLPPQVKEIKKSA